MKKLTMMKMYGGDSQNLKEMKRLGIVDTVEQMYGIIATLNSMRVETTPADKNNNFAARVTVSNLLDFGSKFWKRSPIFQFSHTIKKKKER